MRFGDVISLFNECGLSPESLADWIDVSNSTYRRWQKLPAGEQVPDEYRQNIAAAVFKLIGSGRLSYESVQVSEFVERNIPDYFKAAVGQFAGEHGQLFDSAGSAQSESHQEKITALLSQMGSSAASRSRVLAAKGKISKFAGWGSDWQQRIHILSKVLVNKKIGLVDQLVAYGALFYLILPFDLIPDAIPVFGYVDDFGILGFATAYYARRFPEIGATSVKT